MNGQVIENHKRCIERLKLFRSFGYDTEQEMQFILEKAQPLYGDILEIGTGKGHFAAGLALEGHTFTTIDISEENQAFARLNLQYLGLEKQAIFKTENAERLSFKNNSFDVIFSINTLHHLDNPFRVLDEFVRVLSFEGKIILSDFNKAGFELVGQIHASEDRIHELGVVTLQETAQYLSDRYFVVQIFKRKYQETLIACRPMV